MADSVRITIEADDKTAAGIASAVANLGKIEKAASAASGKATGIGGTGAAGLSNAFGGVNKMLGAVGLPALGWMAAIGGVAAFTKSAITTSQQYATSVLAQSKASGTNAEQSSRMIQVLDDYKITAQDALVATKALTREGYAPTVETLAKLSDEYLKLNDVEDRNAFVLKNLGKAGLEWTNLLSQGSTAIMEMNANVDKNLILSDKQLAMSEKERLALDAVSDTWEGVKIQAGLAIGEMIVKQDELNKQGEEVKKTQEDIWKEGEKVTGSYEQWTAAMIKSGNVIEGTTPGLVEYRQAVWEAGNEVERNKNATEGWVATGLLWEKMLAQQKFMADGTTVSYAELLKGGVALTRMQESFADSQEKIRAAFGDNAAVAEIYKGQLAGLKDEYKDGEMTAKEYYAATSALTKSYKDGSFAAEEQKKALAELETVQDKQGAAFLSSLLEQSEAADNLKFDFAAASGQITQGAAEQFKALDKVADSFTSGGLSAEQAARAVRAVSGDVAALNGMTAQTFVDVFIRTHGTMITGRTPGAGSEESVTATGRGGREVGLAGGSTSVPYGTIAEVGEKGREGLIVGPDGRIAVVPAGEWSEMKKYGVAPEMGYAEGGIDSGGSGGRSIPRRPRPSSQTGTRTSISGGSSGGGLSIGGILAAGESTAAAAVENSATMAAATQESAQRTIQAQRESSITMENKLDEILTELKQTRQENYQNARASQQMNI